MEEEGVFFEGGAEAAEEVLEDVISIASFEVALGRVEEAILDCLKGFEEGFQKKKKKKKAERKKERNVINETCFHLS